MLIKILEALIILVLMYSQNASANEMSEAKILQAFKDLTTKHALFVKDEMRYRKDLEDFEENIYLLATKDLAKKLDAGKCTKCITPYLETLKFMDGAAGEEQINNLKGMLQKHTMEFEAACKGLYKKEAMKAVSNLFEDVYEGLAYEKRSPDKIAKLKKALRECH